MSEQKEELENQQEDLPEEKPMIISIKTLSGDILSGEFAGQKEEYSIPVFQFVFEGLVYSVPLSFCEWWSIGEDSAAEVKRKIFNQMKESARTLLQEERERQLKRRQAAREEITGKEEEYVGDDSDEESHRLTQQAVQDRTGFQGSLQAIAQHQQGLSAPDLSRIVQPGDNRKRQASSGTSTRHSMSRLPDDQEDL